MLRSLVILSWTAGMLTGAVCAQTGAQPRFETALAACFAAQHAAVPFSGIVVAARGQSRFVRAEGTVEGRTPHDPARRYRLASVGKVLTQVAIARLVDRGRIRLDAPIGTYLPGLPAPLAAVTVDQLLQHRSGVSPRIMLAPDLVDARRNARTARDLLPLVINEPLAFAPGSQTQYSNGGYFILGAIVEAASGISYADFLQREILGPLGMTATSLAADDRVAPAMTRMTEPGSPPLGMPRPSSFPELPATPAGDAVSSAEDMLRLARALNGRDFISDAAKAAVFPNRAPTWRIGQAGGRPGANSFFFAFPELDAGLVVLSNYDPPGAELMGQVLSRLITEGTCRPLTAADLPGPMRARPGGQPRPHI